MPLLSVLVEHQGVLSSGGVPERVQELNVLPSYLKGNLHGVPKVTLRRFPPACVFRRIIQLRRKFWLG